MFRAEIKAYSVNDFGQELLTVSATFPRIILAEVNTHRMLSKNTSSSRAIPYPKMVESVVTNPFIPIAWQKNHPGMQGTEYLDPNTKCDIYTFSNILRTTLYTYNTESKEYIKMNKQIQEIEFVIKNYISRQYYGVEKTLVEWWLLARDKAVEASALMFSMGVTKQLCNRLIEPFMWTTMLITGPVRGGWDNFFNLRCPIYNVKPDYGDGKRKYKSRKQAILNHPGTINFTNQDWLNINEGQGEIHIMKIAEMIYDTLNESTPIFKKAGEWHIPYFNDYLNANCYGIKVDGFAADEEDLVKIATSMAARESYTVVGEKEISINDFVEGFEYEMKATFTDGVVKTQEDFDNAEWIKRVFTEAEKPYIERAFNHFKKGLKCFRHIPKIVTPKEHIKLYNNLVAYEPPHSSPMEHCGLTMNDTEQLSYFRGEVPDKNLEHLYMGEHGWCRNFRGFFPLRHLVENNKF